MHPYRKTLAMLPTVEQVETEAVALCGETILAIAHEAGVLRAHYRAARTYLESLIEQVERSERLAQTEPDDEDEDDDSDDEFDYGGEGFVGAALDPSAVDLGHVFVPATDATRNCLGRETT